MLYPCLMMNERTIASIVLNWNVRGLNAVNRRQVIRDMIRDHSVDSSIVWLQETKNWQ